MISDIGLSSVSERVQKHSVRDPRQFCDGGRHHATVYLYRVQIHTCILVRSRGGGDDCPPNKVTLGSGVVYCEFEMEHPRKKEALVRLLHEIVCDGGH